MKITCTEWNALMAVLERIAVAHEAIALAAISIASTMSTDEQIQKAITDIKSKTAALGGALKQ